MCCQMPQTATAGAPDDPLTRAPPPTVFFITSLQHPRKESRKGAVSASVGTASAAELALHARPWSYRNSNTYAKTDERQRSRGEHHASHTRGRRIRRPGDS